MHITAANFVLKKIPFMFRGKNRKVKLVGEKSKALLRNAFAQEEKNLFYLRHPYLTIEQSMGHLEEIKHLENEKYPFLKKVPKIKPDVTLSDKLGHLLVRDVWD